MVDRQGNPLPEYYNWLSLVIERTDNDNDFVEGAVIAIPSSRPQELRELLCRELNYKLSKLPPLALKRLDNKIYNVGIKVKTFLPITSKGITQGGEAVIRKGYLDNVTRCLEEMGFCNVDISPKAENNRYGKISIVEGFRANSLVHKELKKHNKSILLSFHKELSSELRRAGAIWYRRDERWDMPIPTALHPIAVTDDVYQMLKVTAKYALSIAMKALKLAAKDRDLGRKAGFSKYELDLVDFSIRKGDTMPQIARVDMTIHQGKLHIFEINSDSPGGMYHLDVITEWAKGYLNQMGLGYLKPGPANICEKTCKALLNSWAAYSKRTGRSLQMIILLEDSPEKWQTWPEFKYNFHIKSDISLYLAGGLGIEYRESETTHDDYDGYGQAYQSKIDRKRLDLVEQVGIGIEFPLFKRFSIFIEDRFRDKISDGQLRVGFYLLPPKKNVNRRK